MPDIKRKFHWRRASDSTFCGREYELSEINRGIDNLDSFAIIGQIGLGKSMMLRRIKDYRDSNCGDYSLSIIVDVSGYEKSAYELVNKIIEKISKEVANKCNNNRSSMDILCGNINSSTTSPLINAAKAARSTLGKDITINIFFDNFHRISNVPGFEDILANLEYELFGNYLNASFVTAIFCGNLRLKELLSNTKFSNIWQELRDIWLKPLCDNDLENLINLAKIENVVLDSILLSSYIGKITNGHPSLTQYILRDLLDSEVKDFMDTIDRSVSRFQAELSKMIELSWFDLNDKAKLLYYDIIKLDSRKTNNETINNLSLKDEKLIRELMACGFVRLFENNVQPPGKAISKLIEDIALDKRKASFTHSAEDEQSEIIQIPVILHLTDLHFGDNGHAWDDNNEIPCLDRPAHDQISLCGTLKNFLKPHGKDKEELNPRVLIVSGDLLYQGQKNGIEKAVKFLNELSKGLNIESDRVVLCPGNHEQNRILLNEEPKAQLAYYREIWNRFYPEEFRRLPLEWEPGSYTHLYKIDNLEILSLNSCEYLTNELVSEEDGSEKARSIEQGYIGKKQLEIAEEMIKTLKPKEGIIRIAVFHHHLSQYNWSTGVDYSIMKESNRVLSWLRKFHFDLIFHGHQHCPGLYTYVINDRYISTLSCGSAGVVSKHRWRGGMPLMFQLVYGAKSYLVRKYYSFDLHEENWVPDIHETPKKVYIGPVNCLEK